MKMCIDTESVAEAIAVEITTTAPPNLSSPEGVKGIARIARMAFRVVVGRLHQDPRRHAKLAAAIGVLENVDAAPFERDGAAEYLRGELGV